MGDQRGSSWVTFNRAIKEGKESLKKWIDKTDEDTVLDYLLRMYNMGNVVKTDASDIVGKNFLKELLGETEHSNTADVKYRGLEIEIKNATSREYPTRARGWTFNCIELDKFDYLLFIGQDGEEVNYWLMTKAQAKSVAPTKRNSQKINGKVGYSVGISVKVELDSWKRYEKFLINKNDIKDILDANFKGSDIDEK